MPRKLYETQLDIGSLPQHIAIIMDGNGRWAAQRGLPRIAGHKEGLAALQDVLDIGHELNIPYLTIYAFSQENWNRPESEIRLLMGLLEQYLSKERQRFTNEMCASFQLDDWNSSLRLYGP